MKGRALSAALGASLVAATSSCGGSEAEPPPGEEVHAIAVARACLTQDGYDVEEDANKTGLTVTSPGRDENVRVEARMTLVEGNVYLVPFFTGHESTAFREAVRRCIYD